MMCNVLNYWFHVISSFELQSILLSLTKSIEKRYIVLSEFEPHEK